MNRDTYEMLSRLEKAGISREDAFALRRIAMTLHRWHELECGTDNGCIERDEHSGIPQWRYATDTGKYCGRPIPDRETGALKRLKAIASKYPGFVPYVQSDPRGASLYMVPKKYLEDGRDIDSYYSQGIAIYK